MSGTFPAIKSEITVTLPGVACELARQERNPGLWGHGGHWGVHCGVQGCHWADVPLLAHPAPLPPLPGTNQGAFPVCDLLTAS